MALITCDNISLAYENNVVLSDLSFSVHAGDYLCIVGENGSGKSTLIKALLSFKRPLCGSIQFGDGLRQTEIGYLPQQTGAQKDFPASVWEVVQSGCMNQSGLSPFYSSAQRSLAQETLKKLDLWELRRRSYRELSGGQQQRVLLARALCATHKLLLLDEPVAGLGPMVTLEMYRMIQQLNQRGITIIMVSHDIQSAVQYASHILHLHNRPLFFGSTADYLKSGAAKQFLGGPEHD